MDFPAPARATDDVHSMVRDQTNAFILSRTRVGLWLLLVVDILFAALDLVSQPQHVLTILALRLMFTGLTIVLLTLAQPREAMARAVQLALLAVALLTTQLTILASLRGDADLRAVLLIAFGTATSLVVPWGVWPQIITMTLTTSGGLAMVCLATGMPDVVLPAYPVTTVGLACLLSVYGASVFRRSFTESLQRAIDRERAESALRESERRSRHQFSQLDALYRTAPLGLAWVDTDLRYVRVNEALAEMHGVPESLHVGRTIREVVPEMADSIEPVFRRIMATGQPITDLEVSAATARAPAETRHWRVGLWPAYDANGSLIAVSCVVEDITEQRRVQDALRQNEERLRIVSQATNDAVWDWDLVTNAVWWNEGVRTLFGYAAADVGPTADWWYEHIHPEERERIVSGIHAVIDSGGLHWSAEYRYRCADGTYAHVFDRGSVFRDGDGKGVRMIGAMIDISARKRSEEALAALNAELEQRVRERTSELAAANARLSALIDNTNDAIWSIDRAYRLTGFNSVVQQLFLGAHGKQATIGQISDVPQEERDYWHPLYDRTFAGEHLLVERDYAITGELHSYLISMTPIIAESGVVGATVYAKDITDLRRAEERVRQHQRELTHVLRVNTVGEMAAGLAHEINQPLGAIANYAQGCRRRIDAGAAAEALLPALEEIAAQALRAGDIIRRLRQLVQKGRTPHEEADLNAIVTDAAHVIEPQARHQNVTLTVMLGSGLPPVYVDQIQVAQVLLNLMLNALEAMQTSNGVRREVSVHTGCAADGAVEVAVSDTGVGLTHAVSEKMFEPFFTSKPSGLGLGLAISRSIIEEHGGRLWATNNAEHGATFYVTLPAASHAQAAGS
jgi:two-component system, LuxR family, sensor kinase FixL